MAKHPPRALSAAAGLGLQPAQPIVPSPSPSVQVTIVDRSGQSPRPRPKTTPDALSPKSPPPLPPHLPPPIPQRNPEPPAVTEFKARMEELRPLIALDIPGADFATKTNQALLATVLAAYDVAYADLMKRPETAKIYGLMALVDRAMELSSEIRGASDSAAASRALVDFVIRPAILRLVENLASEITTARTVLQAEIQGHEDAIRVTLEKLLRGHGLYIGETAKALEAQIMATALPPPPSAKKRGRR